jgi:hypothetical protein
MTHQPGQAENTGKGCRGGQALEDLSLSTDYASDQTASLL